MNAQEILDKLLLGAVGALGEQIARDLYDWARDRFGPTETEVVPPRVTRQEIETYLRGRGFAPFVADKVIRAAYVRFATFPPAEQQAILQSAARIGTDPVTITREVVRYVAGRG